MTEINTPLENPNERKPKNFIYEIIDDDIKTGKWGGRIHTRFLLNPMAIFI